MKKRWFVYAKKADFKLIAQQFGIDPVTARVMRNRDIIGEEAIRKYLHGTQEDLYDPMLLSGTREAAEILQKKIREKQKIRVIGDYDIDGVCATCILTDTLRRLGADADYDIPDRMRDGYGLHIRMVEDAFAAEVDTLITCYNGITAAAEITQAKRLGMTVIVTDHHQPSWHMEGEERVYDLPPADVLIDPHLSDDTYPFKEICGAVAAWKLMQVLADAMEPGTGKVIVRRYLDLACFATVGDVMDLRDENRLIVKLGLAQLKQTENIGLSALISAAGMQDKTLSAYHIGFVLGPCINAGGRLKTALIGEQMLLSQDRNEANELAEKLVALNEERKVMTQQQVAAALEQIAVSSWRTDPVYVLYLPQCHESIAGIVAGKIRESCYHPVFVLTDAQQPGMLKGSGRSIEGYHMHDALQECSELLAEFGGHPMAAGLTMKRSNLERLREMLNEKCTLTEEQLTEKIMVDMQMPLGYISERLVNELSVIEPCGKGNARPLFAEKKLELLSARILGANRNVLKLAVRSQDHTRMDAMFFGEPEELLSYLRMRYSQKAVDALLAGRGIGMTLNVLYSPDINEYRGEKAVQIIIRDFA